MPVLGDDRADRLVAWLRDLYARLGARMRARWRRHLPFDETVFDRWERARALGFGEGSSVYHNSYIYGDVSVGDHTWIGPLTVLDGSGGGLSIGRYCSISAGVHIYSHNTVKWAVSGGRATYESAPVRIEDCCYIGPQTVIAMGVTVGTRSVIGAGSFVNRDVPPGSIAVGAPCRIIGEVKVVESDVGFDYHDAPDAPSRIRRLD